MFRIKKTASLRIIVDRDKEEVTIENSTKHDLYVSANGQRFAFLGDGTGLTIGVRTDLLGKPVEDDLKEFG